VVRMEDSGASADQLSALLGKGRAKKGMLEGDLDEGELEIGQVAGLIHEMKPAGEIVVEIMREFVDAQKELTRYCF